MSGSTTNVPNSIPSSEYSSVEESRYRGDLSRYLQSVSSRISSVEDGSLSTSSNTIRRASLIRVPIGQVRVG